MTIVEISHSLGVAGSTVSKFTKRLGYKGFHDFRTDLLAEEYDPTISVNENVSEGDSILEVAQKVFRSSKKSMDDTLSLLSQDGLGRALKLLEDAERIVFFGCGESGILALDAQRQRRGASPHARRHQPDQGRPLA